MKRGYKSACDSHPQTAKLVRELRALRELRSEICQQVWTLPERGLSRAEVKRDFGFSDSGLRVLEQLGWLTASSNGGNRKAYHLHAVLAISLLFPGFAQTPRMRVRRKHSEITTVAREAVERIIQREAQ